MAFTPDLDKAREAYLAYGPELFALCYLHAGGPKGTGALLNTLLCDLVYSPRRWALASRGREGLFRCMHSICLDRYYTRPKRQKKRKKGEPEPPRAPLPFVMTDSLRALLALPPKYKTPLYLRVCLGWSAAETAAAIGGPAGRVEYLVKRGLKKAKLTPERAKQAMAAVAPLPDGPEEQWNLFLIDREDKGFEGQQRLRRFKRGMDHAIPYIALGVVLFCVLAYQGVEHGWFSGQSYAPSLPGEVSSAVDYATATATVFGIDNGEFIQYNVTNCPLDPETLVRQMVALGGAPEGTTLLDSYGQLTIELSKEAAQADEQMLSAMLATFAATYPDLEELHVLSDGQELVPENWLGSAITPARTVTTPYHE